MPTSYTNLLGLALPVTGELSGTWGDTVNDYITQYLDAAVAGTQTISGSLTAVTLSKTTAGALTQAGSGAAGSSQYQIINCTGNPAGLLTITAPAASKAYLILNNTSTSQSVKIVGVGPTTGVTIAATRSALVAWNGSDFELVASTDASALTGILATANGGTGLTGFTAGNNAIYSTSASALTAGTLPVAAGGTGATTLTANNVIIGNGTSAVSFVAPGTSGNILTSNGTTWSSAAPAVTLAGNNAFTGANTFYNATGQTFGTATAAQDGIILAGRAGGTSTFRVTLQPTTLGASRTLTLPDNSGTVLTTGATVTVAQGGTGLTSGTSGGVLYYSATGTLASSAALASNALVVGGGAGVAPSTITTGTGVVTALGVNTGTAGAFVVNGGALGTPSSGTLTNATGLPISTGVSGLGAGIATFLATPSSANLATAVTDETGSGALVFASSPSLTTPALAGETFSTSAAVTAGTNAQGQGALTSDYNIITTAASNPSGVTLPTATTGRRIVIVNKGANTVNVYPATGGTIDALAANASIAIPTNNVMIFNASSTTQWYSSFNLYTSATTSAGVTSFSAGSTGLTPNTGTTGAITLGGTLATGNGGTGLTTFTAANNAIYSTSASALTAGTLPVAAGGTGATTLTGYVKGNGTSAFTASATVAGADVSGNISGNAANVTGTVAVANGGTGATTLTANNVIIGNGTSAVQFVAPGTNGNVLTSNGTTWTSAAATGASLSGNNAFTGANTFYNGTGQTFGTATSTQDGIVLQGRAGGTSSLRVTMTPASLTASRTLTLPDNSGTVLTTGATVTVAQGGTGATTLTANNVILGNGTSAVQFVAPGTAGNILTSNGTTWVSSASADATLTGNNAFTGANTFYNGTGQTFGTATSTQDGIVIAGRAGGTTSLRVTLQPGTLTASRTATFPDATGNVVIDSNNNAFTGANTFYNGTGQTFGTATAAQDGVIIAGRAGGTSTFRVTIQPGTLGASRTLTLPDNSGTVLTTGAAVTVAQGGTGITSGTSGGIPYFNGTTSMLSSALLTANALMVGGGAGGAPATITTGTGVVTALGVNTGSVGAFVVNGGALGTPNSGTLTNATGLPISTGVSGLGTGVATALAVNTGSSGAFVVNGGALGTPSSGTLTNATGLPISTGVSGLGTGVATALAVNTGSSGAFTTNNASNTFTAAQTFRAASAIRSEAAATQDAVVLAGRAGGTSSFAVTLQPTTLSANRTLTLPDNSGTVLTTGATVTVAQGGTGATTLTANNLIVGNGTSAVSFIAPGLNGTVLSSTGTTWIAADGVFPSANNSFTGINYFYNNTGQTFGTATSTQDGIILAGRSGGTSSFRVTLRPTTLGANRTLTLPDVTATVATTSSNTFTSDQTIQASLVFDGLSRRIQGDFSNATIATRTLLQSSTSNGNTIVGAIPNGTSTTAGFLSFNNSTPTNSAYGGIAVDNAATYVYSDKVGSGTALPMAFIVNGSQQALINTDGEFRFNSGYGSAAAAFGCRAWVNFNGTGTVAIQADGNVSSITDNGTGDYTVNFTTALVDANYATVISTGATDAQGRFSGYNINSASAVRVRSQDAAAGGIDQPNFSVSIFR